MGNAGYLGNSGKAGTKGTPSISGKAGNKGTPGNSGKAGNKGTPGISGKAGNAGYLGNACYESYEGCVTGCHESLQNASRNNLPKIRTVGALPKGPER